MSLSNAGTVFFVSVTQDFFLEVSDDPFILLDIEYCLGVTFGKIYLLLWLEMYHFLVASCKCSIHTEHS